MRRGGADDAALGKPHGAAKRKDGLVEEWWSGGKNDSQTIRVWLERGSAVQVSATSRTFRTAKGLSTATDAQEIVRLGLRRSGFEFNGGGGGGLAFAQLAKSDAEVHLFTALGSVASTLAGTTYGRTSPVYFAIGAVLIVSVASLVLGGMKRVAAFTDLCVPFMAVLYCGVVFILIGVNWRLVPFFFSSVFGGAFAPDAVFGGAFGVAVQQGIKRGLMVNEAGQGTITMAAAAADNRHPVEQGLVQSMGVFFDTVIICSMAGFVTVMARLWAAPGALDWQAAKADKLLVFMTSARQLAPGTAFDPAVQVALAVSYALFAFTTLIGMIVFAEISANMLSRNDRFILGLRAVGALVFVPFGVLTVLADLQLGNIWYVTDLVNIIVASANVPIILAGGKHVLAALRHYELTGGKRGFVSAKDIGLATPYWTEDRAGS